jgi:hypothetical protein
MYRRQPRAQAINARATPAAARQPWRADSTGIFHGASGQGSDTAYPVAGPRGILSTTTPGKGGQTSTLLISVASAHDCV